MGTADQINTRAQTLGAIPCLLKSDSLKNTPVVGKKRLLVLPQNKFSFFSMLQISTNLISLTQYMYEFCISLPTHFYVGREYMPGPTYKLYMYFNYKSMFGKCFLKRYLSRPYKCFGFICALLWLCFWIYISKRNLGKVKKIRAWRLFKGGMGGGGGGFDKNV